MKKSAILLATEANLARVSLERDASALALSDLVAGRVTWFRNEFLEIGVSRETGAHGGLVIVRHLEINDYAQAYFFEAWFSYYRNYIPPARDAELLAVRDLAFRVSNHVREKQEALARKGAK